MGNIDFLPRPENRDSAFCSVLVGLWNVFLRNENILIIRCFEVKLRKRTQQFSVDELIKQEELLFHDAKDVLSDDFQ